MNSTQFFFNRRVRKTPYSNRVDEAGVVAYTVYNHMLLPTLFDTPESDYWHLCQHVQVWDVSGERQVELKGPDAAKLAQLMTPRDLSKIDLLQGKYAPICNAEGFILNDPIIIKLAEDRFWLSISDSDVRFFAQGLAQGYGLDVEVFEPDVSPLAVQGPKADDLMARVFGEKVRDIRFFRGEMLEFRGVEMYVARSGWSKQGGFEIYMPQWDLGEALWDELFANGEDLDVRAGCPQGNERLESGLLSYGNDMDECDTPFECGLDSYLNLDADIESLSLPALKAMAGKQTRKLVGLSFDRSPSMPPSRLGGSDIVVDGEIIGEIRSQAWSYRYNKNLAIAMLPLSYINENHSITIDGQTSAFHPIPFVFDQVETLTYFQC
ncbi:MAG: dimethylsulfoniopropionate demethylase [Arenicella sp.]|jgi:dimethylsulfoniopropionate demethylase